MLGHHLVHRGPEIVLRDRGRPTTKKLFERGRLNPKSAASALQRSCSVWASTPYSFAARVRWAATWAARAESSPRSASGLDLGSALREHLQQPPVHALDLGVAVVHWVPAHPEPVGQLAAQHRLVDEPGRAGVAIDDGGVDRPDPPSMCSTTFATRAWVWSGGPRPGWSGARARPPPGLARARSISPLIRRRETVACASR